MPKPMKAKLEAKVKAQPKVSAKPAPDQAALPPRTLRFSRRMVALALCLAVLGAAMIFSSWQYGLMIGVASCASGFAVFFTAGCYWGCDNESCS